MGAQLCCYCIAVPPLDHLHHITLSLSSHWHCASLHPAQPQKHPALLGCLPTSHSQRLRATEIPYPGGFSLLQQSPVKERVQGLGCSTSVCELSRKAKGCPIYCSAPGTPCPGDMGRAGTRRLHHSSTGQRVPTPFYKRQCSCNKECNNPLCLCG